VPWLDVLPCPVDEPGVFEVPVLLEPVLPGVVEPVFPIAPGFAEP
jgi:hypothetical protein